MGQDEKANGMGWVWDIKWDIPFNILTQKNVFYLLHSVLPGHKFWENNDFDVSKRGK